MYFNIITPKNQQAAKKNRAAEKPRKIFKTAPLPKGSAKQKDPGYTEVLLRSKVLKQLKFFETSNARPDGFLSPGSCRL